MSPFDTHPDVALGRLAAAQHSVVGWAQLVEIGIRGAALGRRLERGRLYRVHRGVYAVGNPRLTREGRWLAAVLAAGPGAVLSHLDAAVLWGIHDRTSARIHVTSPRRTGAASRAIRLHRARRLDTEDITVRDAIPVTTVARTSVDLTDVVGRERLSRILREAAYQRLLDLDALDATIARAHGRRRVSILVSAVQEHRPGTVLRSELEHRFLELCRTHGLPAPESNVRIEIDARRYELDCFWPEQGVVVELDGAAAHATARAFEADRARDAALVAAGLTPLRYTWRRLERDERRVVAELAAVLAPHPGARSSRDIRCRIPSDVA